jgi:hypothetical protein
VGEVGEQNRTEQPAEPRVARFLSVRRGAAFPRGLGARRRSTLGEKYLGPGVRGAPPGLGILSACTPSSPAALLPSPMDILLPSRG